MNLSFFKKWFEKENKEILKAFIYNIHWGENLTEKEAKDNLEKGLIELLYEDGQHAANGLMITENGYFMTSAHCIHDDFFSGKVQTGDGTLYSIEKVCIADKKNDVALIKAKVRGEEKSIVYKYHNCRDFSSLKKTPIVLLMRREKKFVIKGGYTNGFIKDKSLSRDGDEMLNQMILESSIMPGDSGGILATTEGRIVGTATGVFENPLIAACAPWHEALKLISAYYYK